MENKLSIIARNGILAGSLMVISSCQSLYNTRSDLRVNDLVNQAAHFDHKSISYLTQDGVLVTTVPNLEIVAEEYDINLSEKYYPFLQPGNRISMRYSDGEVINQVIPGSMNVATRYGRVSANGKRIEDLDSLVEATDGERAIITQQSPTPYSVGTEILFSGKVRYFDPHLSPQSGVVDLPISLTNLLHLKGFGIDADYLAVSIPKKNKERGVNGILAFASIQNLLQADSTNNLALGYDYNVIALSRDTLWTDLRQALGQLSGVTSSISGIINPIKSVVQDLDSIDLLISNEDRNFMQRTGNSLNEVKQVTSATRGIRDDLEALSSDD